MASATVAGVAALVKSYFPKLTGSQIRDILLKSVTSRKGVEVEKGIRVTTVLHKTCSFSMICVFPEVL